MTDPSTPTRRRFLAAVGSVTAAGIAGCSGDEGTTTTTGLTPAAGENGTGGGSLPTDAFSQFRGGLQRRGYFPEASVPADASIDWEVPGVNKGDHTAAKASFVPLPSGDFVVPGDDGSVYRVTPEGDVVWAAATHPSAFGIHGTPAVAGGRVYVGAYDGAMYAFDAGTGDLLWRTDLGDAIGSSPGYYDGTVYIAVEYIPPDGSLFAVDAESGEVLSEGAQPTDHPHSTCAVDRDLGRIVVGSNDGGVYCWEWPAMEHAWTFQTEEDIKGPIAVHDGAAFVGSWDQGVYRIDLESGEQDWRYETDDMVMSGPAIDPDRGVCYIGSHDQHCHAIDAGSGEGIWETNLNGWIIGCPVTNGERVLVGSYDARLAALSADDGQVDWTVRVNGRVSSSARIHDGAVYFTERATSDASGKAYRVS